MVLQLSAEHKQIVIVNERVYSLVLMLKNR